MQFGSTARNVNLLTLLTATITLGGLFNPGMFTILNIFITIISFYIMNILGVWMMLHRYFAHRSFEFKNDMLKWGFALLAILSSRGSPLGWVYLHRKHHAFSDTEKDPHSPKILGYKIFGFNHYKKQEEEKMQIFMVKDLMSKDQIFIHKWYMVIILLFVSILALINLELMYFIWAVPAFLIHLSQTHFNYFGHMYGYKNQITTDDSRNNKFLFPILLGEAWHNNHHADPKNYTTKKQSFEYDPLATVIKVVKK